MTTRMNLIFTLFLAIFCSCEKVTIQKEEAPEHAETGMDEPNVAFIDQFYQPNSRAVAEPESVDLNKLISQLENVKLIEKKTVSKIPRLFLSFLESPTEPLSMADPGGNWHSSCGGLGTIIVNDDTTESLPTSQLIYFGLYEDIALMAYNSGTNGHYATIIIFKFSDTEITDHWEGRTFTNVTNKETILALLKETAERNSDFVPENIWCSY